MRGVMLDRDSLHPEDLDFSGLAATLTDWDWHPSTAVAELPGRLAGREVVVTNKVPLDGAAIREAVDLRLICVAATGVDNVDLGAARARGIPVCNVRNYGTAAVGQHVLALLLALATRWHQYAADVRAGAWSRADNFCLMHRPVMELAGLAVLLKRERRRKDLVADIENRCRRFERNRLAGLFVETRFRVECVDLRRPAVHEKKDHGLGFRGEPRRPWQHRVDAPA